MQRVGSIALSNIYAYADGDPIGSSDPLGLFDSVTAACMQSPEICQEIFGQIAQNFADLNGGACAREAADAIKGALSTGAKITRAASILPFSRILGFTQRLLQKGFSKHGRGFGPAGQLEPKSRC